MVTRSMMKPAWRYVSKPRRNKVAIEPFHSQFPSEIYEQIFLSVPYQDNCNFVIAWRSVSREFYCISLLQAQCKPTPAQIEVYCRNMFLQSRWPKTSRSKHFKLDRLYAFVVGEPHAVMKGLRLQLYLDTQPDMEESTKHHMNIVSKFFNVDEAAIKVSKKAWIISP